MVPSTQTLHQQRGESTSGKLFAKATQLDHHRHTMQDLLPPAGHQQELQGHPVSLNADLDSSLQPFHFLLLSKATLVLLQQADAFLIDALQRTNHSSANNLTSCVHWRYLTIWIIFSDKFKLPVETTPPKNPKHVCCHPVVV